MTAFTQLDLALLNNPARHRVSTPINGKLNGEEISFSGAGVQFAGRVQGSNMELNSSGSENNRDARS